MLESALRYLGLGYSVIPVHGITEEGQCTCGVVSCGARGKHPRGKWGEFTTRRPTEKEVRSWWGRWPSSNIGIVTGAISGIVVVDVDGERGRASLEEAGIPVSDFPVSPRVSTGGGGVHIYLRYPGLAEVITKAGVLPGVDIRADGGQVIAPPSVHASGRPYAWVEGMSPEDLDPADMNWSLLFPDAKPKAVDDLAAGWYEEVLRGVPVGSRNSSATRLAGRYLALGMSWGETLGILRMWNRQNATPLEERELTRIVQSIHEREVNKREGQYPAGEIREAIGAALGGLHLLRVRQVTGEAALLILEFAEGEVRSSVKALLRPAEFQSAIMEGTGQVIRRLGAKTSPTQDQIAQLILNIAEHEDAGAEATDTGETVMMLREYLETRPLVISAESAEAFPDENCVWWQGSIWFSLPTLLKHARMVWGGRVVAKEIAQRLKVLGADRSTFSILGGGQRILWGVRLGLLGWGEEWIHARMADIWASGDREDDDGHPVGETGSGALWNRPSEHLLPD